MTQAIEQLTEAAKKLRLKYDCFTSVSITIDATISGIDVVFRVWCEGRFHHGKTLDEAVNAALNWSPRAAALKEAAELRAKADEIEASVIE